MIFCVCFHFFNPTFFSANKSAHEKWLSLPSGLGLLSLGPHTPILQACPVPWGALQHPAFLPLSASSSPTAVTTKYVSRRSQMFPGARNCPRLRTTSLHVFKNCCLVTKWTICNCRCLLRPHGKHSYIKIPF